MTMRTGCESRRAPFLQRNWVKGITALQNPAAMGNIVSSPGKRVPPHDQAGHEGAAPLKKRRISTSDPFEIDDILGPNWPESRATMRVEVLKIFHRTAKKVGPAQNGAALVSNETINSKASCRVTILEQSSGRPRVLHCQSQVGDLVVLKDPAGPHRIARVDLPQPFFVPEESILINRPEDGKYGLSSSYEVLVELEAAHDARWPPFDAPEFGLDTVTANSNGTGKRNWILSSRYDSLFGRLSSPLSISSGYTSRKHARQTDYSMRVDLRWSSTFKAPRRPDKSSRYCENFSQTDASLPTNDVCLSTPGEPARHASKSVDRQATEDPPEVEQEQEEAHTPSRSLRARENKVYNLRILSDQAQGRDRKHRSCEDSQTTSSEGRVTYLLPSDQPVCLDLFRCVTCGAFHRSIMQLQLHLKTVHPGFDYFFETTSQGPQFRVKSRSESLPSASKTHDLRRPTRPFNIQSFIAGDQTWVTSRLDPKNVDHVFQNRLATPTLPDKLPSRPQLPTPQQHPMQRRSEGRRKAKLLVPDIPQPLFHPISRAQLVPGQPVPISATDSAWLIQKHRESIADYDDVTPSEKEYIQEWDGYILSQALTSAAFFPRAWVDFVRQKSDWLVAAENRMLEFGKHMSTLLVRDLIEDDHVRNAFSYINASRATAQEGTPNTADGSTPENATTSPPRTPQVRKGTNGCAICQLPVLGPRTLICANKKCSRRLYHSDCAGQDATSSKDRKWLCSACRGPSVPA